LPAKPTIGRGQSLSLARGFDVMRALFAVAIAFVALLCAYNPSSRAAIDNAALAPKMELLVFEHADCVYCRVFRRDVVPRYLKSSSAADIPLRFIDISNTDVGAMPLNARIQVVPTAVLMKDGHEVDRIVGYWSPDNFFKMLSHIRARAE
jgi:thioredoxin-related protein